MSKHSRNSEFWAIVENNFPQASHAHELDEKIRAEARYSEKIQQEYDAEVEYENFIAASFDERIAGYFLEGDGSEESLIIQLQSDYNLSEQRVLDAIDRGIGQLHEIVDIDDEA